MRRISRGQTEVIGVILLIGISTMVIGGSIVVATGNINDFSRMAQSENGENSISHIESEMSAVAIGESQSRKVDFSQTSTGRYLVLPDSGEVSITHTVDDTEEWNVTRRLGAIAYNSSNRDIAYQGGGVWSKEGDYTSIVSQPEFDYTAQSLTFPIIQVRDEGGGDISYASATDATTLESDTLDYPLENGSVRISVTSRYYEGWYEYFKTQTATEADIYHANNTATATLVTPDTLRLEDSVTLAGEYDGKSGIVESSELTENSPRPSAGPLIDSEFSAVESNNDNGDHTCISESDISGSCTLTAGSYYIDSDATLSDDLTLDVSGGNISIAVNGTFDTGSNSVRVEGDSENQVSYYIADDLLLQGGADVTYASGGSPLQNQFFVGDQFTEEDSNTNGVFEGIVYAPESETDDGGNLEVEGAVILDTLSMDGNGASMDRGGVSSDKTIDVTGVSDTVRFMHITTNRVTASIVNSELSLKTPTLPYPDEQCGYVEDETDGGTEDIDIVGIVVDCDVETDKTVEVDGDGFIIGDAVSDELDLDQGTVDGDADIEAVLDVQDGTVTGSATSNTANVNLDNATVEGSVTAEKVVDIIRGSTVGGDVESKSKNVKVLSSTVSGSITANEQVKLDDATVKGDVYIDESKFDCTDSTINGQDCTSYSPRDPDSW